MKKFFTKEIFMSAGLNDAEKKQHRFYIILLTALLLLGSVTFFEFLYEFCNMVGSIVSGCPHKAIDELLRMLPLQLTAIAEVYMFTWVFNTYRADNAEKRAARWKIHGVITAVLGAIIAGYVVGGAISGQYGSFVEGFPSLLFPLDVCIGGVLLVVFGFFAFRYGKKQQAGGTVVSCQIKGGFRVFHTITYMIGIQSLMCCAYGLFVMDWSHGMIIYNIVLWLNYFAAAAMVLCYIYIYAETKAEMKKAVSLRLGLIFLIVNAVLFALYIVFGNIYNEAPNLNAYGILPIEFTASFNAFLVLMGLNNFIAPIAAIINSVVGKKKE